MIEYSKLICKSVLERGVCCTAAIDFSQKKSLIRGKKSAVCGTQSQPHAHTPWAHSRAQRIFCSVVRLHAAKPTIFSPFPLLRRKHTFRALVHALYGTTYGFRVKGTGPYVDPCERVAVFLYRVGGGRGVRETAGHFDIAEGTVVKWTKAIAHLVMKRLEDRYLTWPDPEEQRRIAKEWEDEKELRCAGGSHCCGMLGLGLR